MDRTPLTKEGYDQLQKKLEWLKGQELPRIQRALGEARELGDISDSAEFRAAREEMWRVEALIGELETKLATASVVDDSQIPAGEAAIGRIVKLRFLPSGTEDEFLLVGGGETRSDITPISIDSPLGRALIGKKAGTTVEYEAPRGKRTAEIVDVRPA